MIALPHSTNDLMLAPVVLAVSASIEDLSRLSVERLAAEVALVANSADATPEQRRKGLLRTVGAYIDTHGWTLAWDGKDIRMSHRDRSIVLGVPQQFLDYVDGTTRAGQPSAAQRG